MSNKLMIHFGELYLKKNNRKDFISRLRKNISHALATYKVQIETKHDHLYISQFDESHLPAIIERLQNISGIHAISEIVTLPRDLEAVKALALTLLKNTNYQTFKVVTKRKDKMFPLLSDAVNRELAGHILDHTALKVDIHHPEFVLRIEIDFKEILVLTKRYEGLGGYPLGASGKGLILLSGGIDSPVAAYLTLRRGIKLSAIHFAAPPYTSEEVIHKLEDLLRQLTPYQPSIRLYIVPFTDLQLAIYEHVPHSYAITVMRRMMMRISEVVAKRHGLKILVTGESLGQVASQTLESLVVINEVTNYPVIRPLATTDKNEIIRIAKRIGTYPISILPYEDCCTIFHTPNPVTSPLLSEVKAFEERFDYGSFISKAIGQIKKIDITAFEDDEDLF